MKTKTRVRAGSLVKNHNETLVRDAAQGQGLRVKTHVRAGGIRYQPQRDLGARRRPGPGAAGEDPRQGWGDKANHNETLVVNSRRRR